MLLLSRAVQIKHQSLILSLFLVINIGLSNDVPRMLKKIRTSKGDYWIEQRFSSIVSLFKIGTSFKGKN